MYTFSKEDLASIQRSWLSFRFQQTWASILELIPLGTFISSSVKIEKVVLPLGTLKRLK